MGFGNSNNWQTEAVLRNERLAKQTSLDKLLEHVNWDAETLTLSLSGITLSWGDIAGAGDVAMKSDIPTDAHITQITENTISTMYIVADSVAADHITNATLWGNQYGFGFDTTKGFSVGYVGDDVAATANLTVGSNNGYGTISINAYEIVLGGHVDIYTDGNTRINGYDIVTSNMLSAYLSDYATKSDLSNYVKKTNNGFSQCTGDPSSMVCILNGELRYITKSTIKSWLGIS